MRRSLAALLLVFHHGCAENPERPTDPAPNIVYILADDLGYGDLSCTNRDSKLATTNFDRLASQGMLFRDAHSGSAVCTPTPMGS